MLEVWPDAPAPYWLVPQERQCGVTNSYRNPAQLSAGPVLVVGVRGVVPSDGHLADPLSRSGPLSRRPGPSRVNPGTVAPYRCQVKHARSDPGGAATSGLDADVLDVMLRAIAEFAERHLPPT